MDNLPVELLREIIELAAESDLIQAALLSSVSSQFHTWAQPALCRTVIALEEGYESMPPQLNRTWLETNGRHVRGVLVWGFEDPLSLFELCPHITEFSVWWTDLVELLPVISKLPIRKITSDFSSLFGTSYLHVEQGRSQLFQNVTHLEVIDAQQSWLYIQGLTELPQLTHFAFPEAEYVRSVRDQHNEDTSAIVHDILRSCPRLKVLVMFVQGVSSDSDEHSPEEEEPVEAEVPFRCDEPRMIAIESTIPRWEDWVKGRFSYRNAWEVAEKVVQRNWQRRQLESTRVTTS
ncbi:hypothetical protein BDN72DRAFT_965772 [Pluteus cervinus]|uniref:Uncharacterized protein n=1 Tax=Pluteus cervinus TaxID=181527 RepID=A0ACD3A4G0_9AGAR|nr:hypothetical protein BDN72DRAFT_965772 [Pluteus cervinus]